MQLAESGEMYLEAILVLEKRGRPVRSIDVVEYLSVSKPSVSRAVGLLREGGYLTYDENKLLRLTEKGRVLAEKIYERHTVLSSFLRRLNVPDEIAAEDACRIEHDISDCSLQAIKALLERMPEEL